MGTESAPWLVTGLGNPGARYARTRHNAGFRALDALRPEQPFHEEKRFDGAVSKIAGAWLLKPLSFMNLSGIPARTMADFYKIPAGCVLAVFDDASLPFGRLRLRPGGGPGAHNGMESLIVHFGTEAIPRLRIGIGQPPPPVSLHDHVLGAFTPDEEDALPSVFDRAAAAISCILKNGLAVAMNEFNKGGL